MTRQHWGRMAGAGALFAVLGCGASGGGAATTACTLSSDSAEKTCIETSSSQSVSGGIAQAKADCTKGGGIASDACSHVGADGGCKSALASGTITLSTTTWYYAGAATTEMASCVSGGSTWIAP